MNIHELQFYAVLKKLSTPTMLPHETTLSTDVSFFVFHAKRESEILLSSVLLQPPLLTPVFFQFRRQTSHTASMR